MSYCILAAARRCPSYFACRRGVNNSIFFVAWSRIFAKLANEKFDIGTRPMLILKYLNQRVNTYFGYKLLTDTLSWKYEEIYTILR